MKMHETIQILPGTGRWQPAGLTEGAGGLTQPRAMPRPPSTTFGGPPPRAGEDQQRNGFSLVELMVVIFIIGLLATVVLINVLPSQEKAMRVKAQSDIATMAQAMEMYRLDNMAYPGVGEGLASLRTPPANLALPQNYRSGGYIKDLPSDPWGRPYQFVVPGQAGHAFEIFSLGADGKPGGEDNDADIYADKR